MSDPTSPAQRDTSEVQSDTSEIQRDTSEVHGRTIAVGALGVLLLLAMAAALIRLLSTLYGTTTSATLSTAVETPRLSRADSARELVEYRAAESAWLQGYGWQDRAHSYAHIPIGRAMQLLLQPQRMARPGPVRTSGPTQAPPSVGKPPPQGVPRQPDRPAPLAVPPAPPAVPR